MRPKVTLAHRPELDGDAEPVPMLTDEELARLRAECVPPVDDDLMVLRLLDEHAAFKARALTAEKRDGCPWCSCDTCVAAEDRRLKELYELLRAYAEQPVAIQEVD